MAEQTGLDVVIRAILESKGFDQLQERLKASRENAKEAAGGIKDFSEAIEEVTGKLGLLLGVGEATAKAFEFLKDSFAAFVAEARALDQFQATNRVLGGTIKENTAANREWLESLELTSGISKNEIIPSYQRLLAVTGDISEAQRLSQIAANAAKAGLSDVAGATQALIRYMETGATGTRGFGAVLGALKGNTDDVSVGLSNVERKMAELGGQVKNIGLTIDQLNIRWERTKEVLGSLGASFVNLRAEVLEFVAKALAGLSAKAEMLAGDFRALGFAVSQVFKAVKEAASGELMAAQASLAQIESGMAKILIDSRLKAAAALVEIEDIWSKHEEKLNADDKSFKDHADKHGNALDELKKKYQILADNAVQLGMEEVQARLAVLKVYQQMANDPAVAKFPDLQAEANKRLVGAVNDLGRAVAKEAEDAVRAEKQKEKAIQETNDAWLSGEKKRIDAERKGVDEAVKLEIAKYKALERGDIDYLRSYQAFLQQQLVLYKGTAEEKARLDRELATTTIRLEQIKQDAYLATAGSAIAFASAAFGQNKAVMIAEGILNAYAAYARAQKDYGYPYSLIIGGLAFATTMAQVAAMEPVEPNTNTKGFDDPGNDFAAMVGGRKWAKDMIMLYGQGAAAGFSDGMRGGSTVSHVSNVSNRGGDRHVHVTLNAGMGTDRTALIQFVKRDLVPVLNRIDRQRDIQ